jgi:chromosome partitioning protein
VTLLPTPAIKAIFATMKPRIGQTMQTVAILSEKGGAGKTTLAVHLATAAQLAGIPTAIIDLDPQASAADWADSRSQPPEALAIPPARLSSVLEKLKGGGVRFVVIDTGRDSNNAGYTAAQAADLILVPCRVGRFDIRALSRTLDLAKLAGKPAHLIFNDLAPRAARMRAEAEAALRPMGCQIAPVQLSHRAMFRDAPMDGKTAQEAEPGGPAAAEVAGIFAWVCDILATSHPETSKRA